MIHECSLIEVWFIGLEAVHW